MTPIDEILLNQNQIKQRLDRIEEFMRRFNIPLDMTIEEVKDRLGSNRSTVERYLKDGKLRRNKRGRIPVDSLRNLTK